MNRFDFDKKTDAYIEAIKSTESYQNFKIQNEKIKKYPDLKAEIDEYRRKNFELQNTVDSDELFDKMEEFQLEYATFREDPIVSEFLEAELDFCRMMQASLLRINQEVEFE